MEYSKFLSVICLLVISGLTIYIGCLRSYAIYFFERESRRVLFLEPWGSAAIPVALSFMLIVSYLTSKRSLATSEEISAKKLCKSSQTSLRNVESRKMSHSSDLEGIPELPTEYNNEGKMLSISESENDDDTSAEEDELEKKLEPQLSRKSGMAAGDQLDDGLYETGVGFTNKVLDTLTDGESEKSSAANSNVIFTLTQHGNEREEEWFPSRKSSTYSNDTHREHFSQRKQSEIYKQIGKIDLLPMSLKKISFHVADPTPIRKFRKDSLFDVVVQLLGIHLPIWLSVTAFYITLVEILNMRFYTMFYYHHPGLKLFAMVVAVLLGIFYEWKPHYIINNILGVAAAYVVIARVQTISYVAGVIFLIGMVLFDLFWMYGIDLFSTVTQESRAPIMLIIPWGTDGKKERLATLDIIVPGIFLNIVLKFADMYDSRAFYPSFYAVVVGLTLTFAITLYRGKSTPAIVLPALFSIIISSLSVHRTVDLWRFEIKH